MKEIQERTRVEMDISMGAIAKVVGSLVVIWLAIQLWTVLVLVLVALMLVATFNPMVAHLQAHMSRRWALAVVILGLLVSIAVMMIVIVPVVLSQIPSLLEQLPGYARMLQEMLERHGFKLDLHQTVVQVVDNMMSGLPQVVSLLTNVVSWIFDLGTILVLVIYLLIEGPEVSGSLLRACPQDYRDGIVGLCHDVGVNVGKYMRGQLVLSLMAGTYFLILLLLLQVPDAVALALVAALADAIPLIGLLIALVFACLTSLAVSPWTAALVAFFYLLYHQLEANVIAPRVFGASLGLSVTVIVIAILAGLKLMGVAGGLLSLPVAAAIPGVMRYLASLHDRDRHPEDPTPASLDA